MPPVPVGIGMPVGPVVGVPVGAAVGPVVGVPEGAVVGVGAGVEPPPLAATTFTDETMSGCTAQ
ncbi:hypothetical protein SALBM311S_01040 [Streptomyces alboniger]